MSVELESLDHDLGRLEQAMVKLFRALEAKAEAENDKFIRMPAEAYRALKARLEALKAELFSTGDTTKLRLVTDQHDAIRIRLIYAENLLKRDIPRPYVEQALREFTGAQGQTCPVPAAVSAPVATTQKTGLLATFAHWLKALLGGGKAAPPQSRRTTIAGTVEKTPDKEGLEPLTLPEHELRLIYLHKLMEEDVLALLDEKDRPPSLPSHVKLPDYLARFSARDFAEAHFNVRVKENRRIARTPEELRRKLAERSANDKG